MSIRENRVGTNEYYLARQAQFESNVRSYPRKIPLIINSANGVWITDVEGKKYIDCLAGAGTLALGHNHPVIKESIKKVIDQNIPLHTLDLSTPLKDSFSQYLYDLLKTTGSEYCLQFCSPSGADAVEAALKLSKKITGRSTIISFSGGYHGMTHGALGVTGNLSPRKGIEGLMGNVYFMPYPNGYRCAFGLSPEKSLKAHYCFLENFLRDPESGVNKPAAVILEVIQGEGGVNPAPKIWLQQIRKLTRELGILLIVDEVQTGFCRTGDWFAFQYADIDPDLIVMSKAVGGGLPLSLLAIKKQYDVWGAGDHTGTFRGNQLAMATGLTTLKYLEENNMAQYVQELGRWFIEQLNDLKNKYPEIGDIRGRGLMIGIEIIDISKPKDLQNNHPSNGELASRIQQACFDNGLILERGGRGGCVLRLLPPLIISQNELKIVLNKLEASINRVIDK